MHFNNKVVWITGASSGIGAELAKQLAVKKARLILTARNITALTAIKNECSNHTDNCKIIAANLSENEKLEAITKSAMEVYGHIDMVIFSAGISQRSLAIETKIDIYRQLMEINFFSPVSITHYLLPYFKKQKAGHIIAISSVAGLMGFPLRTGYAASKHALKGYFETLQTENQIKDLHITIVSPGRINTPISVNAITGTGKPHGLMDKGQLNGMPVNVCARKIINAIIHKRKHIIIAQSEKFLWWLWWFARPLYYKIARKKGLLSEPKKHSKRN